MIGKTISHYTILEEISRGGMGVVYRAEDTKLKRTVALKFLPPQMTQDHEARARFIQEAQAASAIDHPGYGQGCSCPTQDTEHEPHEETPGTVHS